MRRLVVCCAGLAFVVGFGGSGMAAPSGGTAVTVTLYSYKTAPGTKSTTKVDTFTLTCNPPAGTLPFAARICRDIRAHPVATLTPPAARTLCSGSAIHTSSRVARTLTYAVKVKTVANGVTSVFGTDRPPECAWPVGWATGLYSAAASGDAKRLAASEAKLGCLEDPALLAEPTPWTLVYKCMGWPLSQAMTNETTRLLGRAPWLARSMRRTLVAAFAGVPPISTRLIVYDKRYDRRIVVLFEFADVVYCQSCGDDPTALAGTNAKVFRVSYDPETRRGLVTRLCPTVRACR